MMRYTFRDLIISGLVLIVLLIASVFLVRVRTPAMAPRAASSAFASVSTIPSPVTATTNVHSPDGTMQLMLKEVTLASGTQSSYLITDSDVSGTNRKVLYQAVYPNGVKVRLPANSWSPDNKFVFFTAHGADGLTVLVFSADGTPFVDGANYIDLSSLFRGRFPDAILRDVTGWDDPALLHVMTYNADKTIGLSYWFDIWSRSFIQLAHR